MEAEETPRAPGRQDAVTVELSADELQLVQAALRFYESGMKRDMAAEIEIVKRLEGRLAALAAWGG